MFVCCECCVLTGRGLCDGLIIRPEESYRLWCVVLCDLETSSRMRRRWPALGCSAIGKKRDKRTRKHLFNFLSKRSECEFYETHCVFGNQGSNKTKVSCCPEI